MVFEVKASGRKLSDGQPYELQVEVAANDAREAEESIEDFDWADAAPRHVQVTRIAV